MGKYLWRPQFNEGHIEYQVYWTKNISTLTPGDRIEAFKVANDVNESAFSAVTTWTVTIKSEAEGGGTYNIILV